MFDIKRLIRFLGKLLKVLIPFLLSTWILAFGTEFLSREGEWHERLLSLGFWLEVMLDMLPAIAVMILILWLAGRFVHAVFHLDSWTQGVGFLMRHRFGLPGFGPWMRIQKGQIDKELGDEILEQIGGPGHLVIYNDSAVVLQRGGKFTRVEGAGFPKLKPFEKIYAVLDLRPKRWLYTVSAMTKEGVPIKWDADVHYQLGDGGKKPTEQNPFPLSKKDVFRAATSQWVFAQGGTEMMDWEGRVIISDTEGKLRTILARCPLDQLIGLTEKDAEAKAARESIQTQLEDELRQSAPKVGAKILRVKLSNLQVDDDVTQQWIQTWQARWQSWSEGLLAQGEASRIYLYETVKAEAQAQLVVRIIQALQQQTENRRVTPQIILMRLFSVLDRAAFSASSRIFFPNQALDALDKMKSLLPGDQSIAADVTLTADPTHILVGGFSRLTAIVRDAQNNLVPDGIPVQFLTDLGDIVPRQAFTLNGRAASALLARGRPGTATVTARAGSGSGTATVDVR